MKASERFPSKFLKAADLGKARPVVTIAGIRNDRLGDDEVTILAFKGKDKELILNRTNWNMIAEITGQDDDDNWIGHQVMLYATRVDYQGKRVDAIRVDYPPRHAPGYQAPQPPQPPVNVPTAEEMDDETVPF